MAASENAQDKRAYEYVDHAYDVIVVGAGGAAKVLLTVCHPRIGGRRGVVRDRVTDGRGVDLVRPVLAAGEEPG